MRMRGGLCAVLASVAPLAACSGGSDASDPKPAAARNSADRALRIPTLAETARCPTSPRRPTSPGYGAGLGDGPVYPVGFSAKGELAAEFPPFPPSHLFAGSGWGGTKVLWVANPKYEGPIRIRGRRLDGKGQVRFDLELVSELDFPRGSSEAVSAGGWREFPSHTRVRAPGCFAYQVDGEGFSDVIVFEAVPSVEECTAGAVRRLVDAFLRAFNRGDEKRLDLLFAAEPEFRWYSVDGSGTRLRGDAYDRETLLPYFSASHKRGERFRLTSFRFNGASAGYGHFQYELDWSADDLPPVDYLGKGAAICTVYEDVIAVWSMGRE